MTNQDIKKFQALYISISHMIHSRILLITYYVLTKRLKLKSILMKFMTLCVEVNNIFSTD